jgi:hypothetical protein
MPNGEHDTTEYIFNQIVISVMTTGRICKKTGEVLAYFNDTYINDSNICEALSGLKRLDFTAYKKYILLRRSIIRKQVSKNMEGDDLSVIKKQYMIDIKNDKILEFCRKAYD